MIENNQKGIDSKTLGFVAYLTLIGWIIALVMNQNANSPTVSFHLRQMLGLMVSGFVLSFISWIPILGWIVWAIGTIFILALWLIGFIAALNGEQKAVPVLGEKFQEIFAGIR